MLKGQKGESVLAVGVCCIRVFSSEWKGQIDVPPRLHKVFPFALLLSWINQAMMIVRSFFVCNGLCIYVCLLCRYLCYKACLPASRPGRLCLRESPLSLGVCLDSMADDVHATFTRHSFWYVSAAHLPRF